MGVVSVDITYLVAIDDLKLSALRGVSIAFFKLDVRSFKIIFAFNYYVFGVDAGAQIVLLRFLAWPLDIGGH